MLGFNGARATVAMLSQTLASIRSLPSKYQLKGQTNKLNIIIHEECMLFLKCKQIKESKFFNYQ